MIGDMLLLMQQDEGSSGRIAVTIKSGAGELHRYPIEAVVDDAEGLNGGAQ